MSQTVRIKCKGSRSAKLADLEIIQGELKELSEEAYVKLRKRIEKKGFDAPLFVWGRKVLDGTQRKRVLERMIEEGWTLPGGRVPVCEIEADSLEDAKDRLLGYVSQFGRLTGDGLYEFVSGMDALPDLDLLDLPNFDLEAFKAEFFGDEAGGEGDGAGAGGEIGSQYTVVVECASEMQQEEIYDKLTREGLKCRLMTV